MLALEPCSVTVEELGGKSCRILEGRRRIVCDSSGNMLIYQKSLLCGSRCAQRRVPAPSSLSSSKKLDQWHELVTSQMKSFNDESTVDAQLVISNESLGPLQLIWLGFEGEEKVYNVILSSSHMTQPTFSTHAWLIKDSEGQPLLRYMGPSASLTITTDQGSSVEVLRSQQ